MRNRLALLQTSIRRTLCLLPLLATMFGGMSLLACAEPQRAGATWPPADSSPEGAFPVIPFRAERHLRQLHRAAEQVELLASPTLPSLEERAEGDEELTEAQHEEQRLQRAALDHALGAWVVDTYSPWMNERTGLLAEAQHVRDEVRTHPNGAPIVAAALQAFLMHDTAFQLRDLRVEGDAGDALRAPVAALLRNSLHAYEQCYEAALSAGSAFDGWHRFCGAGLAELGAGDPEDEALTSDESSAQ